jgi:3-deoxy-manno-octulosonate cytidylyltransferase (CMP-KDO synthetase)
VRVLGVIPARYRSARFPGKPLALINGKPMIQWVYERARRARLLDGVIVATDDRRIEKAVRGFGGKVVMTSARHHTGTDRVAEVARNTKAVIVVNIQGDEPLIEPGAIDKTVKALTEDSTCDLSTLAAPAAPDALFDPDVVKVVCDRRGQALYFSRAAIPYRNAECGMRNADYRNPKSKIQNLKCLQHIGLYAYRRETLQRLSRMAAGKLEGIERLEQLRALENGLKIKVVIIPNGWPSVDRPEDLNKVERLMERTRHA